mmetsp:Transcript_11704/g.29996  ORF Transcript_11704/g.29996 Transcript_11704/m.29996 type:complete len:255 (+) Transcript_11704:30-794(+)|eukprot:CAMPEP_0115862986 /NCGR_PEP_ID=MMETSP0287-20121206/18460_1 /TAXON_ID=412157 /ORGANISM="Chrysochromulina rotalis, Strain UIO044" /LENGTH=254 /DNA_ID=CAMNT_0003317427 /DNA_START=30 /DNA_END=794 /DNA_ORIENTATION=+
MSMRRSVVLMLPLLLLLPCVAELSLDHSRLIVPSGVRDAVLTREHFRRDDASLLSAHDLDVLQQTTQRLRGGGSTLSRLLPILLGKTQCRILMVGLDAAGKTTILYQLKLGEMTNTAPTLGFNVETVAYKNIEFMVWDMGGQDAIRPLWRHYYENAQALIFVVDSADEERLDEAREELAKLMSEEQLKDAILLVYANKQDMPESKSVQDVADALELTSIRERTWYIQACSAQSGDGIRDGLDWLASKLAKSQKK